MSIKDRSAAGAGTLHLHLRLHIYPFRSCRLSCLLHHRSLCSVLRARALLGNSAGAAEAALIYDPDRGASWSQLHRGSHLPLPLPAATPLRSLTDDHVTPAQRLAPPHTTTTVTACAPGAGERQRRRAEAGSVDPALPSIDSQTRSPPPPPSTWPPTIPWRHSGPDRHADVTDTGTASRRGDVMSRGIMTSYVSRRRCEGGGNGGGNRCGSRISARGGRQGYDDLIWDGNERFLTYANTDLWLSRCLLPYYAWMVLNNHSWDTSVPSFCPWDEGTRAFGAGPSVPGVGARPSAPLDPRLGKRPRRKNYLVMHVHVLAY